MRKLASIGLGLALSCGSIGLAAAQDSARNFPSHPITMIVPFAAGGPLDTVARIMGDRMARILGQNVIIENVTGAAGSIGVGRAARADPDGYTLSIGHWSTHVVNGAIYQLPYDVVEDFDPIALLPSNPMIIVSNDAVPAKTLKELIAWIKGSEHKVLAGTAGVGSASHIAGVYFQNVTGTSFQFVPYRGTGPAMLDLISGQINLIVDQASNSLQQIRAGRIRPYAVTAAARLPSAPDIPTVDEAGVPGFYISVWYGLWAPRGTPPDIIDKLNLAAMAAMADPYVRQRFAELGLDIPPREQQTPEALGALQRAEIKKWWPIIKAAGIKAE